MDAEALGKFVHSQWMNECIPKLEEYIRIPNVSPFFVAPEQSEAAKESQDKAMKLINDWVVSQPVAGMTVELVTLDNRSPLLFIEVAASEGVVVKDSGTVLLYGHMDKQPPFTGWHEGLSPYEPVIKEGKLYGRGGADDGYAVFSAITAIRSVQEQGIPHSRCVLLVEACEESGSPDLPYYIEYLKTQIGRPNLVICLDSGCGNYEQLWITSSLRGMCAGRLKVELLTEGVHSGASGIVPDTFRIARDVLSRIECPKTGDILLKELHCEITPKVYQDTEKAAHVLGYEGLVKCFPLIEGGKPVSIKPGKDELTELALNQWYRPQLTVTGASGLPDSSNAGNVLRPFTTLSLSMRLPPACDATTVAKTMHAALSCDPPSGASITFDSKKCGRGWSAPPTAAWLDRLTREASMQYWGKEPIYQGEGGSIPFMGMLGEMFPDAQFLIIGVLGPNSNAHGPNEFLHIEFSEKLTSCVGYVIGHHAVEQVEKKITVANNKRKVDEIANNYGRNPDGTKF